MKLILLLCVCMSGAMCQLIISSLTSRSFSCGIVMFKQSIVVHSLPSVLMKQLMNDIVFVFCRDVNKLLQFRGLLCVLDLQR